MSERAPSPSLCAHRPPIHFLSRQIDRKKERKKERTNTPRPSSIFRFLSESSSNLTVRLRFCQIWSRFRSSAMEESYTSLPTSHLLGSVPAVISEEKKPIEHRGSEANLQIFPPNGGGRGRGYQTLGSSSGGDEQQQPNTWKGAFNVSSYSQFFNVDTDVVLDRIKSSLNPINRDFFRKIDDNPDLYGMIWISTTLVFVIAALGNCATYLTLKQSDTDSSVLWSFDVNYFNVAACIVYGYALVVPAAFSFLLQYLGSNSNANLVRFWCLWGYSLFIFIPSSFLLLVPVEFLRWVFIIITGSASACFVALNLQSYVEGNDLTIVLVASFVLQLVLALFIKVWLFP